MHLAVSRVDSKPKIRSCLTYTLTPSLTVSCQCTTVRGRPYGMFQLFDMAKNKRASRGSSNASNA